MSHEQGLSHVHLMRDGVNGATSPVKLYIAINHSKTGNADLDLTVVHLIDSASASQKQG